MTILLATSCNNGQDARDKHVAAVALRAEATLAPQDGRAQSAFSRIVGRIDAFDGQESPECGPQAQQVVAERSNSCGEAKPGLLPIIAATGLVPVAWRSAARPEPYAVFEAMPDDEQVMDLRQGFLTPGGQGVRQLAESHPVALQVRPADLTSFHWQLQVSFEAIRGHNPLKRLSPTVL